MNKVYIHRRKDTNEIFYVGHGAHARPWSYLRGRSQAWQAIYNQAGVVVEVIARYPDKASAAAHEQLYIAACREQGIPIVNQRSGGFDRNQGIPSSALKKARVSAARLRTNGNRCAVRTPLGVFVSISQAAHAHNMSLDQLTYRLQHKPGFERI